MAEWISGIFITYAIIGFVVFLYVYFTEMQEEPYYSSIWRRYKWWDVLLTILFCIAVWPYIVYEQYNTYIFRRRNHYK